MSENEKKTPVNGEEQNDIPQSARAKVMRSLGQDTEARPEIEVEPVGFWENFWYHHKWKTIIISFVVILLLSFVLDAFHEVKAVQYAFFGIRAGVLALLCKSLWTMYKKSPKGWASYIVMAAAFVLTAIFDINVIFVIIGCALFGLITATMMERREEK